MNKISYPDNLFVTPVDGKGEIFVKPLKTSIINKKKNRTDEDSNIYSEIECGENRWIERVCTLAIESVKNNGGPFSAILLQLDSNTNEIIRYWEASNKVTIQNDPTAHAEINAIRSACNSLGVFNLGNIKTADSKLSQPGNFSHCVLVSSCEPCPMCISAVYWARIEEVYFAATRFDAAQPGVNFSDEFIYLELSKPYSKRKLKTFKCLNNNSLEAFSLWKKSGNKMY